MRESIFKASWRYFFITFFVIVGAAIAFAALVFVASGISSSSKGAPFEYRYEVLPGTHFSRETLAFTGPVILQIDIKGVIGLDDMTKEAVERQLVEAQDSLLLHGRVRAILLSIDSPGGMIFDTAAIYHTLQEYKKQFHVPVYAYVDGLCASGAFYIACAADKIYTSPTSVVGSVGVISEFFNVADLLEKIGVKNLTLAEGKGKDALNPFRPWKPDEDESYVKLGQFFYQDFLRVVTTNRPKLHEDALVQTYGAQVFIAPLAEEYGYIDSAKMSRNEVLQELAKLSGVADGQHYQIIRLAEEQWINSLFHSEVMTHRLELGETCDLRLANQMLYLHK